MSLVVHLVRHGAHDGAPGTLAGRDPAIRLSPEGVREAQALARDLRGARLARVLSSPQPRTVETAEILSRGAGVVIDIALDEIDFGSWAGRAFAALEHDPAWRRWNAERDTAATPAGETMTAVADRVDGLVAHLRDVHADGDEVALVTHCDVIRATLCRVRGLPFSHVFDVDIATASRTTLAVDADGTRFVLAVNRAARSETPGIDGEAPPCPPFVHDAKRLRGARRV